MWPKVVRVIMLPDVKVFTGPTNEFGSLLLEHCRRLDLTPSEVSRRAGFSGNSRLIYAMRPEDGTWRTATLREEELVKIAQILRLNGADSTAFVIAGLLEGCPPRIRSHVQRLERENALGREGRRPRA